MTVSRIPGSTDSSTRLLKLAERLFTGGEVSHAFVVQRYGVSFATAKRDLVKLEQALPVERKGDGTGPEPKVLRLMANGKGNSHG